MFAKKQVKKSLYTVVFNKHMIIETESMCDKSLQPHSEPFDFVFSSWQQQKSAPQLLENSASKQQTYTQPSTDIMSIATPYCCCCCRRTQLNISMVMAPFGSFPLAAVYGMSERIGYIDLTNTVSMVFASEWEPHSNAKSMNRMKNLYS